MTDDPTLQVKARAVAVAQRELSGSQYSPPVGPILAALRDVQRETIQADAKWMQHKADCALTLYISNMGAERCIPPACSCGLADRLKGATG